LRRASRVLPVSTNSRKARKLFEQALTDFVNLKTEKALDEWRQATKADPKFALAHIFVALNSKDPAEQSAELVKAKALMPHVARGEKLLIRWVAGVKENNYVSGIQSVNDLVARYPKDKRLLYIVGNWLVLQESYDQARKLMERALAVDPKYPPALNDLGYAYAFSGDYKSAIAVMERYVASLPGEPNPRDSYGEILRMSGDFEGALQHYRAALKIDPHFVYSQLGIADTYALIGDEERARVEYATAIAQAETEADRIEFEIQSALTYVRDRRYFEADAALAAVCAQAHAAGLDLHEAQAHRVMAQYQLEDAAALKHLEQAEAVLAASSDIPKSDRDEEQARILRWRATRAARAGDDSTADAALRQLEAMENASSSHAILHTFHAAEGAVLMARGKYAEAIPQLEEDHDNAFSMKLLAEAYTRTGAMAEANEEVKRLTAMNTPTIDQALIVIPTRQRLASNPK
jgi:tetratricopeptide (TPR) repeat protein